MPEDDYEIEASKAKPVRGDEKFIGTSGLRTGIGNIVTWIAENYFGLLEAPVMRCASLDTPIPFNIELENNFMAKSRLDETVNKLLSY